MKIRIALDVPPFARSRHGDNRLAPRKSPGYFSQEGASTLSVMAAAAWANALQPVPPIDVETINAGHVLVGNNNDNPALNLHLVRVRAPGGVPAGYRGRTITL